jgi:hypothetical protein
MGIFHFSRVDFSAAEGKYDLHILQADLERDNGRFECRLKEDGTGVELYTKAGPPALGNFYPLFQYLQVKALYLILLKWFFFLLCEA